MAVGRIFHWKHGWIPLDGTSTVHRMPSYVLTDAPGHDGQLFQKSSDAPNVRINVSDHKVLKPRVHVPEYQWSRPATWPSDTDKAKVARDIQDVYDLFPGLKTSHPEQEIQPVFSSDAFLAAGPLNDPTGRYPLGIDSTFFKDRHIEKLRKDWKEHSWGEAADAADNDQFRHNLLVHEMGHIMHVTARDHGRDGPINELTHEQITPRQLGWTKGEHLDTPLPRWRIDPLATSTRPVGTTYGTGKNEYEWFAEAFLDGFLHGDKASPSGKRAYAIAHQLYGRP